MSEQHFSSSLHKQQDHDDKNEESHVNYNRQHFKGFIQMNLISKLKRILASRTQYKPFTQDVMCQAILT